MINRGGGKETVRNGLGSEQEMESGDRTGKFRGMR